MKICTQCFEAKDLSEFYKFARSKDKHMASCKKCDNQRRPNKYKKKWEAGEGKIIPKRVAQELKLKGLKRCPRCKEVKEQATQFYSEKASRCIICMDELNRLRPKEEKQKYYRKNKRPQLNSHLKFKFGITLEQYEEKLAAQNNKCAICNMTEEENGKRLAVDHSHITGQVRDLLCARCNAGIGFLKDDPNTALKASEYLLKHKAKDVDIGLSQNM